MSYVDRVKAVGPITLYSSSHDGAANAAVDVAALFALATEMAHKLDALAPQPEAALLTALQIARSFIRREQIEHAVVDMERPDFTLGQYLDRIIERHTPQEDR